MLQDAKNIFQAFHDVGQEMQQQEMSYGHLRLERDRARDKNCHVALGRSCCDAGLKLLVPTQQRHNCHLRFFEISACFYGLPCII